LQQQLLIPFSSGDLLDDLHKTGNVVSLEYEETGSRVTAGVPRHLMGKLRPFAVGGLTSDAGGAGAASDGSGSDGGAEDDGDGVWQVDGDGWTDEDGGWQVDERQRQLWAVEGGYWQGGGDDEIGFELDPELAAARRHYLQISGGEQQDGGGKGKGGGRRAKAPAVTSEATQKLFSHRLPREWEAVVLGDEGRVAAGVQ
jgi:hypothetical protein